MVKNWRKKWKIKIFEKSEKMDQKNGAETFK